MARARRFVFRKPTAGAAVLLALAGCTAGASTDGAVAADAAALRHQFPARALVGSDQGVAASHSPEGKRAPRRMCGAAHCDPLRSRPRRGATCFTPSSTHEEPTMQTPTSPPSPRS